MPTSKAAASSVLVAAAKSVGARLAALGFARDKVTFVRRGPEVIAMIQLQSSRSSTRTSATYVINYGVLSRALLRTEPKTPAYVDCHWGQRVTDENGVEQWFAVNATDDPNGVADRMYEIIQGHVLPKIDRMQTNADLIALWKTGVSPNLAEAQRLKYLAQLENR